MGCRDDTHTRTDRQTHTHTDTLGWIATFSVKIWLNIKKACTAKSDTFSTNPQNQRYLLRTLLAGDKFKERWRFSTIHQIEAFFRLGNFRASHFSLPDPLRLLCLISLGLGWSVYKSWGFYLLLPPVLNPKFCPFVKIIIQLSASLKTNLFAVHDSNLVDL